MEKIPEIQSVLTQITRADYNGLPEDIKKYLHSQEEVPKIIREQLEDIPDSVTIQELMKTIRDKYEKIRGDKRDTARSFADSRFTPLKEMIDRGMVSCGATTHIFGTVLRSLGVPVRYVHADAIEEGGVDNRHSWLDIYNPKTSEWVETDPTRPQFNLHKSAKRIRTYHDWSEMREDYGKGNF